VEDGEYDDGALPDPAAGELEFDDALPLVVVVASAPCCDDGGEVSVGPLKCNGSLPATISGVTT
jgi:hypothetical protein